MFQSIERNIGQQASSKACNLSSVQTMTLLINPPKDYLLSISHSTRTDPDYPIYTVSHPNGE